MDPTQDVLTLSLTALENPALPSGFGQFVSMAPRQAHRSGAADGDSIPQLARTGSSTNVNAGAKPAGVGDPVRGTTNQHDRVTVDWFGNHFVGVVLPHSGGGGGSGAVRPEPPDQTSPAVKAAPSPAAPLPADAAVASEIASARVQNALASTANFVPLRKNGVHLLSVDEGVSFNNIVGSYMPPVHHFPVPMANTMVAVPGAPEAGYVLDITYALGFIANRPVQGVEGWLRISAIGPDGTVRDIANLPSTTTTYPGDHSARLIFSNLEVAYTLAPGETLAFQAQAYKVYPDSTVRTDIFTLLPGDLGLSADLVTYVKNPHDGTYAANPVFGVPGIAGEIAPIPEPEPGTLLVAGLALLGILRRFRRRVP